MYVMCVCVCVCVCACVCECVYVVCVCGGVSVRAFLCAYTKTKGTKTKPLTPLVTDNNWAASMMRHQVT